MDRSVRRGFVLITIVLIGIAAMLLIPKQHHPKPPPPNDDPWVLVSYDPDNKFGTYLGNGFISTRIMGDGVGSQDGKPLPCFMAGLYDDEKLIPTPTWSDLRFYDGKTQFRIDKEADYKQTLNMKTGILTTYATWRTGGKTLKGKIEVVVSRAVPNVGLVRATLSPDFSGNARAVVPWTATDGGLIWDGLIDGAAWSNISFFHTKQSGIHIGWASMLSAKGVDFQPALTGRLKSDKSPNIGLGQTLDLKAKPNSTFEIVSYSSLVLNTKVDLAVHQAETCMNDAQGSDERFIAAHKAAWAKLWQKDIIIDGPRKDQQAIHSCMFYLLQSVREGSQWSIPPMGLSNNAFSGHVFWDADTWMFPALILQHPELARSIVDYRYNTLPGAMANAKASGCAGAEYAWESGYTGKEDTPPGLVYRNERHITGDVALAQWQYYLATGDLKWLKTRGYPVIKATADYWASRAVLVAEKNRYEIKQVVPPDENAELVNNSAYTNAIARMNLEIASRAAKRVGAAANPKWREVASKLYIPFDAKAKRFIAFDGYKGWKAKQADTELLAYPLQFTMPGRDMTAIYENTFDFYAPKVLPRGPAMSSSAHAVIAARLGECDKAYHKFGLSYKPFLRGPFNYFNEKPTEVYTNMCFLTGCAGPIQATLYGLAGIRMDYFPKDPATATLTFAPCLPKQWKSVKITGVQWHGKVSDVTITRGGKAEISRKQQVDR